MYALIACVAPRPSNVPDSSSCSVRRIASASRPLSRLALCTTPLACKQRFTQVVTKRTQNKLSKKNSQIIDLNESLECHVGHLVGASGQTRVVVIRRTTPRRPRGPAGSRMTLNTHMHAREHTRSSCGKVQDLHLVVCVCLIDRESSARRLAPPCLRRLAVAGLSGSQRPLFCLGECARM